ncbi:MAG: FAD:protein FMN transferase [Acidobacteriia bacterium]|nr:FAD:protein FMN transferase [Terriglobia bacterium]
MRRKRAFPWANVLILWLVPVVALAGEPLRIESSIDAMGSTFTIVAFDEDRVRLESALEESFDEVRRLDNLLSNYKTHSEWSRMNREAASQPVRLSQELFGLLEACQGYSQWSDGAFDLTVGPLLKIWGFYKGSGRLPHRAEIRTAMGHVGYRLVELNRAENSVKFARAGVELDPGGIGKGMAVDRLVEILQRNRIGSALVSAGGSTIYGLGSPPGEAGWKVKIRHPKIEGQYVENVVLKNLSMSTSGTSAKFFISGGKLYSHIFDPRTGYPAQGMLSVSVTAPRALDSEAWTKPFFINGRAWAQAHKPGQAKVFLCEDRLEIACAWLQ